MRKIFEVYLFMNSTVYTSTYIYHYHSQVMLIALVLLTLSWHLSLSAITLDSIYCLYRADESKFFSGRLTLVYHLLESTGECCLWIDPCFPTNSQHDWNFSMVCEKGDKWLYNCWFLVCCFQDMFKTACSIFE